jgi:hypothetical protein
VGGELVADLGVQLLGEPGRRHAVMLASALWVTHSAVTMQTHRSMTSVA